MLRAFIAGAAVAAAAVAAHAQPQQPNPPVQTIVCVDVNGGVRSPVCKVPATRLDLREDICLCPTGQRVDASVCPPGVAPPAESLAVARARNEILRKQPTLVGATYQGQLLCVPPRRP
jgi:hypothetical protein